MSTPQTSYTDTFSPAIPGTLSRPSDMDVCTKVNGETSAIPAGIGVKLSATEGKIALLSGGSDVVAGLVINSFARDPDDLTGLQAIKASAACSVLERGYMWVTVEETVVAGDDVYIRHTSDGGSNTQPGTFRSSADTAKAALCKGARYTRGASAGGVAEVFFDAQIAYGFSL